MAEKTIKTRIKLLYKSYSEWQAIKDTFVPLAGEVCVVAIPAAASAVVQEPAIMFKVGDGTKTFAQLSFTSALAADVFDWAKKEHLDFDDLGDEFEARLKAFIKDPEVSYDTKYQIVANGTDAWKLQKSVDDGETWVDATGSINISSKVDKEIVGAHGTATIFNESDGGGARFVHTDGTESFVGVNDGGETGMAAQIYVDKKVNGSWVGSRINGYYDHFYYINKADKAAGVAANDADHEIAVKGDISEYNLVKAADAGEYAAVYHLTKDGENIGDPINIAKDQFFQGAEVRTCTEPDVPIPGLVPGDKYLDLMFGSDSSHIQHAYIAVKDMVQAYTAGDGIEITNTNEIKLTDEAFADVQKIKEMQKIIAYRGDVVPEEGETPQEALNRAISNPKVGDIASVNNVEYIYNKVVDPSTGTVSYAWEVKSADTKVYELKSDAEAKYAELEAEDAKKVDKAITGTNGKAEIFNEADGGGAHFIHNDGTEAFVGVNDGGESGMMAQIYADKKINGAWVGSRINVYHDHIYYVNKADQQAGAAKDAAGQEIVVKKQLNFSEIEQTSGDVLILDCN